MSDVTIWVCVIGLGLALASVGVLLVVWSMWQSDRAYSVRLYDVWTRDALGCPIELGVVVVEEGAELADIIDRLYSPRFKTRSVVYWEAIQQGYDA